MADTMGTMQPDSSFLALPSELIHHILTFLPASDLAFVCQTCRLLCEHAVDDRLWLSHLENTLHRDDLKKAISTKLSYRAQFLQFHPYWFIPKYKVWYADTIHTGRLLIARYSPSRQCIEAYALAAERVASTFEFWEWNTEVIIHSFDPKVQLDLNRAVLKIDADAVANLPLRKRYSEEVIMDGGVPPMGGINSRLSLTRPLPAAAIGENTQVWPPQKLPAHSRVRNASLDGFRGTGHTPTKASELSEHTFRLRRWMDFPSRLAGTRGMTMRMGEDVSTFATLPPETYTPTKEKPWRGIWVGDYSGHGCEFLVVLQPDEPIELPMGAKAALRRRRQQSGDVSGAATPADDSNESSELVVDFDYEHIFEDTEDLDLTAEMPWTIPEAEFTEASSSRVAPADADSGGDSHQGQILGVKLTGDPNIPRGEYTFVAPDISDAGLIRVATEEKFAGARVVKSAGHIAARDFRDGKSCRRATIESLLTPVADIYIPSQLILISHDTLAQYWEAFGHVSLYRRVDIDKFVNVD